MGSPIPSWPPKRANSAMEASTIYARPGRRRSSGAAGAGQPVPLAGMAASEGLRPILPDGEPARGDESGLGLPPPPAQRRRGSNRAGRFRGRPPQVGGAITMPAWPGQPVGPRHDPEPPRPGAPPTSFGVVPHPIQLDDQGPACRPRLPGVRAGEPLDASQAGTAGADPPGSSAVRSIDGPLTSSSTAAASTAGGIPRGGVSVGFSPRALQRYSAAGPASGRS